MVRRLNYYELKEIKKLEKRMKEETDEPDFVRERRKWMIEQIKQGNMDDIRFDEWGEVLVNSLPCGQVWPSNVEQCPQS